MPLQTTRKENNWKTEEVLARAAVTLETERIKSLMFMMMMMMMTIHGRCVINIKGHSRCSRTQQLIYSVSTQEQVSAQLPSSDSQEWNMNTRFTMETEVISSLYIAYKGAYLSKYGLQC